MVTINKALLDQFRAHLQESALAPATVVNYLADLRAFLRWIEEAKDSDTSPFDLKPSDIQVYCAYLQSRSHAPATVNRRLQALRKFYSLAVARERTGTNPAEQVALMNEVVSGRSRSMSADDVARLLAAVRRTRPRYQIRDWAMIQVFLGAGLKLSELTELRLQDAHLDAVEPCLYVRGETGEPDRTVPLDGEPLAALHSYVGSRKAAPGVEHLFLNRDGNPLSTRSVQRLLHHYAEAAKLETLTTQALRYQYARKVYQDSEDMEAVARLLGHRHLATTIRYLRPSPPEQEPSPLAGSQDSNSEGQPARR